MTRIDRLSARGARRPIQLKRAYENAEPRDGLRILIDRLWPRGLSRDQASTDLWLKEAAPSNALRLWYSHDPRRWQRFKAKYRAELAQQPDLIRLLNDLRRRTPLTLVFGARDEAHSHAVVLREVLEERSQARLSRQKI